MAKNGYSKKAFAKLDKAYREALEKAAEIAKMTPLQVWKKLDQAGGDSLEVLAGVTFESIENAGFKPMHAQRMAKMFREEAGSTSKPAAKESKAEKPADPESPEGFLSSLGISGGDNMLALLALMGGQGGGMGDTLTSLIDPVIFLPTYFKVVHSKPRHPAVGLLRGAYGTKLVICFDTATGDGSVEATAQYMKELDEGFDDVAEGLYTHQDVTYKLFAIGDYPAHLVDMCPINEKPLRSGVCSDTGIKWGEVELSARQLVYIAVNMTREANAGHVDAQHRLFNIASKGFDALAARYRRSKVRFDELRARDELPTLRVEIGTRSRTSSPSRNADPFHRDDDQAGHQRY